jgi:hypothetical protein
VVWLKDPQAGREWIEILPEVIWRRPCHEQSGSLSQCAWSEHGKLDL